MIGGMKGLYTNTFTACNVGVPSGVDIHNRRYVIDEVYGAVDVFCTFATSAGELIPFLS